MWQPSRLSTQSTRGPSVVECHEGWGGGGASEALNARQILRSLPGSCFIPLSNQTEEGGRGGGERDAAWRRRRRRRTWGGPGTPPAAHTDGDRGRRRPPGLRAGVGPRRCLSERVHSERVPPVALLSDGVRGAASSPESDAW